jgi:DNA helicase-2/ATP-dependent DNA helicase PcrA
VVFTDATLTAIAETRPANHSELAMISGVGARKRELYGDDVLAIMGGVDALEVAERHTAATELENDGLSSAP